MPIDKLSLQILANHCAAAAEAMAYTLMRTAHSTFVKETEDFSCGLLTPEGLTFASPKTLGATWYVGLDYGPAIRAIDHYEEGDICVTNDPYSGFVATHTPDIHIWKPVFHEGEIVCFVGGHIHNTDMGGAVPASLSRTLTEIHQEGIRVPPTKLASRGVIDRKLVDMLHLNVRLPEQNWGDLNAQIASVNTGERKVLDIIERFGIEAWREGMGALLDYAEQQARAVLAAIPDGDYAFTDYADEDSEGGYPCRVAVTLKVRGDAAELDFTGCDPQLNSSINIPTGGRERHILTTVGYMYALYTLNPQLVLNAGIMRTVKCVLPEGTVVNPKHPAAVGMRSLLCNTVQQLVIGAFSRAAPKSMPGGPAGGMTIMNVKTTTRDGRPVMASVGPVGGGAGGMDGGDGSEGSGANTSFLRNTPVEINEAEVPIRMLRYGLAPDSGGAGKFRGGSGTVMVFKVFAPNTLVTARNRDRSNFTAWGVLGGRAGTPSRFTKNPGTPKAVELGNSDIVKCEPGDVISIIGPGGGGYGDPFDRDPARVLHDVRCGYVSLDNARQLYGVVIADGEVDEEATAALRGTHPMVPLTFGHFDVGPARRAHEAKWTPERYDALTRILREVPVNWRFYLKHRFFAAMDADPRAVAPGKAGVYALYDKLRAEFPDLPKLDMERAVAAE
jgi:N-methylhydantoinase B